MSTGNEYSLVSEPSKLQVIPITAATTLNLTSHANSLLGVNIGAAGSYAITLPNVAQAVGLKYRLFYQATGAGNASTIVAGGAIMQGVLIGGNAVVTCTTGTTMTMVKAGAIGGWVEFVSDGTYWQTLAVSPSVGGFTVA